jgi:hypothetical protein
MEYGTHLGALAGTCRRCMTVKGYAKAGAGTLVAACRAQTVPDLEQQMQTRNTGTDLVL